MSSKLNSSRYTVPLNQYFPDYTGGTDGNNGAQYILLRFSQLNLAQRTLYTHFTEVSDPHNARFVINALQDTTLQNYLRAANIL